MIEGNDGLALSEEVPDTRYILETKNSDLTLRNQLSQPLSRFASRPSCNLPGTDVPLYHLLLIDTRNSCVLVK